MTCVDAGVMVWQVSDSVCVCGCDSERVETACLFDSTLMPLPRGLLPSAEILGQFLVEPRPERRPHGQMVLR